MTPLTATCYVQYILQPTSHCTHYSTKLLHLSTQKQSLPSSSVIRVVYISVKLVDPCIHLVSPLFEFISSLDEQRINLMKYILIIVIISSSCLFLKWPVFDLRDNKPIITWNNNHVIITGLLWSHQTAKLTTIFWLIFNWTKGSWLYARASLVTTTSYNATVSPVKDTQTDTQTYWCKLLCQYT